MEMSKESLQKQLANIGFSNPVGNYDVSLLSTPDDVLDCDIIASKSHFNVIFLDVRAGWKRLSKEAAKKNPNPFCMVVTQYGDHMIMTTVDIASPQSKALDPKPLYLVVSNPKILEDFCNAIKPGPDDTLDEIYRRVLGAFAKFTEYTQALAEFADDLDVIIKSTKKMIEKRIRGNKEYDEEAKKMLKMCQDVINDKMELDDIKEMLIQHVLTYRVFALVYDEHDFHNTNAVAKSLESLKSILDIPDDAVDYRTMELIAESVTDMDQRQEFLKRIYETFYKMYNPAKADKDGIVYTPSEVVNFMVKSTDQLLKKH